MDRRVKERLVGATILVVLLVLIVPELLSGPKGSRAPTAEMPPAEATRNVTVDLATSKATRVEEPVAGEEPAPASAAGGASAADEVPSGAAPVPSAAVAAPPTITTLRAQQPESAVENPASPPTSASATSPAAKASAAHEAADGGRHGWTVQLGSFASQGNADQLVRQLKGQEGAYVSSIGKGANRRYRVRIGPLADRTAADRVRLKLTKAGHPASLVPP
jgi:DedD protein